MYQEILKEEERISLTLRSLYKKYGYLPYKMSKFEEYDLYVANKEFLVGDGVITFNDTDGRLMALKPDVTLSIIKNGADTEGKRKVYYNESVYRISAKTKQFKEITQVGLECLGDIDLYDVYETVCLAAESLACISEDFVLNLSHLGLVTAILKGMGNDEFVKAALKVLSEKNAHEGGVVCEKYAVGADDAKKLQTLISAHGDMVSVLKRIQPICEGEEALDAYNRLTALCRLLEKTKYADKIRLDFSIDGDMRYYDNVVFKGFIQGIGEGVLSGGRYDKLLGRMGKSSGAIGFAVYLDLLEGFDERKQNTDVDVLILYDEKTDVPCMIAKIAELTSAGKSVRAQKSQGVRYSDLLDMRGEKI